MSRAAKILAAALDSDCEEDFFVSSEFEDSSDCRETSGMESICTSPDPEPKEQNPSSKKRRKIESKPLPLRDQTSIRASDSVTLPLNFFDNDDGVQIFEEPRKSAVDKENNNSLFSASFSHPQSNAASNDPCPTSFESSNVIASTPNRLPNATLKKVVQNSDSKKPIENPDDKTVEINSRISGSHSMISLQTTCLGSSSCLLSGSQNSADYDPNSLTSEWVEEQLKKSPKGRLILTHYATNNALSTRKRNELTTIIIENELTDDPSKLISSERFQALAFAICKRFPTEEECTYFLPYFQDAAGMGHNPRGKLYDKYNNTRRDFRAEGLIAGRGRKSSTSSNDTQRERDSAVSPEIVEADLWLQNNVEPQEEVISKAKLTCIYRLKRFQMSPETTVDAYLSQYPVLRLSSGYLLVDHDYDIVHPGRGNVLFTKWNTVRQSILDYSKKLLTKKHFAFLLKSMNIDLTCSDDTWLTIYALCLLPALLPTLTIKKKWRPSKVEALEGFLLVADSKKEVLEKLKRRTEKLSSFGCDLYPTPVLIGKAPEPPTCYVAFKKFVYEVPTPLKAIDVCIKLFILLKVKVPPESLLSWLFIKCYLYDLSEDHELLYPSLRTFKKDLLGPSQTNPSS